MKDLKRNALLIVLLFLTGTVALFFQNCAQTKLNEGSSHLGSSQEDLGYFYYSYANRPNLYANLALIFPTENIGNFAKFNIYGMVASADGSSGNISYEVRITDDTGQSVCAGDTGVLNADQQNINFECLGLASLTKATVTLTASYNGLQEVFTASFTK